MTTALLILLGIPVWFVAAILITAFAQRRKLTNSPGVFRYHAEKSGGWARRPSFGRWISDVLIQHKGFSLIRTDAVQVVGVTQTRSPISAPGVGDDAVGLELRLNSDTTLRMAIAKDDLALAEGPFARI